MNDVAKKAERAESLLEELLPYYRSYHNHKESMAYAGITLYAGAALASLFSAKWPPAWGGQSKCLATVAVLALWLVVLVFLRFQLHRRRWAALRSAGAERLLADWIQVPPSEEDLAYRQAESKRDPKGWFLDWFIPQEGSVLAVGVEHQVYPKCFVDAWLRQEERGTDAILHERLIVVSGWLITILALAGVWLK